MVFRGLAIVCAATCSSLLVRPADVVAAGVSVVVNRAAERGEFVVLRDGVAPRIYSLAAGEKVQISPTGNARLVVGDAKAAKAYALAENTIFDLQRSAAGEWSLRAVGRHEPGRPAEKSRPAAAAPKVAPPGEKLGGDTVTGGKAKGDKPNVVYIPALLLVDDNEAATPAVWEKRLRERLDAASDILEKQCGVRFRAVAVGKWVSDDRTTDFVKSLGEFERRADPGDARVAIGFTSQYEIKAGLNHLGGTRRPLAPHILLREYSPHVGDIERLEILTHELGHYLGASHAPEKTSVMRPLLGDRAARAKDFAIEFDATNVEIIRQVTQEIHTRNIRRLAEVGPTAKAKLRSSYQSLLQTLPSDPAARRMLQLLDDTSPVPGR